MRKTIHFAAAALLAILCNRAFADVAAIHASALPNDPAVADALKDITALEPYVHRWTPIWSYPVAKSEVGARLNKDLLTLSAAVRANPDNLDLLLLTGLAGIYAYNADVGGVFDNSNSVLFQAAKVAPGDLRTSWFHAVLLCQTADQTTTGAQEFLAMEDAHDWQQLPPAFWADYMECASVTGMSAHVSRARDHIQQLHVAASEEVDFLAQTAQKRFDHFDPKKEYTPKEVWVGAGAGDDVTFTSTSCGLRLMAHGNWEVERLELVKGSCTGLFSLGPYPETGSRKQPSILVLVQQPQKGETLDDYSKRFTAKGKFEPFTPSHCPADRCVAMKGVRPGAYGKDGDSEGYMVVFERDQPPFPGLIFESPLQAPQPGSGKGPQYYRPSQTEERIPGKLYYYVLLDTSVSVDGPAMRDLDFFLQNLVAE